MASRQEIDWMGRWYTIAKERGVNTVATLAMVNPSQDHVEWNTFCHESMDGVGGMTKWLREQGYQIPEIPTARPTKKMSLFKKISVLWDGLRNLESRKIHWKEKNDDAFNPDARLLSYVLFTKEETKALQGFTHEKGMSINSYLLALLHNELFSYLAHPGAEGGWVFPVNMRGNVKRANPYCNQSSGVSVDLNFSTTPDEVHRIIKDQLVLNRHWANWWVYNVGRVVGMSVMRFLSKRSSEKSFFIGTFSNMGFWPPAGTVAPPELDQKDLYLIAAPPGTKNYPISIAVGAWYEKLAISLKIHPYVLKDQNLAQSMLDEIQAKILNDIKMAATSPGESGGRGQQRPAADSEA